MEIIEFVPGYVWLIVAVSVALPVVLFVLFHVMGTRGAKRQQQILAIGVSGTAVVQKAWQTNISINQTPMTGLLLEVEAPNQTPFQVEVKKLIPFVQMGQIQPGSRVAVKFDPAKPEDLVLLLN